MSGSDPAWVSEAGMPEVFRPNSSNTQTLVIPAKAGIQCLGAKPEQPDSHWVPAFAGTTNLNLLRQKNTEALARPASAKRAGDCSGQQCPYAGMTVSQDCAAN